MLEFLRKKKSRKHYHSPIKNPNCINLEVDKWNTSEFVLNRLVKVVGIRPYPLDELMFMTASICYFRPTHIFEWGTHIGKSARIFYEIIEAYNIDAQIYSYDLPDDIEHQEHPKENRGSLVRGLDRVNLFQEDGVQGSFRVLGKSKNSLGNIFYYLDGDHAFSSVLRELNEIYEEYPNAIVLCHDTFFQSDKSQYNVGPYNAINSFIEENKGKYSCLSNSWGLPGMTLIYPKVNLENCQ